MNNTTTLLSDHYNTVQKDKIQYKDILQAIDNTDYSKSDIYKDLMQAEANVLNKLERITENQKRDLNSKLLFYNLTILEAVALFANTWKNIFLEIFVEKQYDKLHVILLKDERKIIIGIMILFIAFVLNFISLS